jgi:hypothetical protein
VVAVGVHPSAYDGVESIEALADQGAGGVMAGGADGVKGEHECRTELRSVGDEPESGFKRKMAAVYEFRANGADDGSVGADEGMVRWQIELAKHLQGEAVAAACGYDDLNAGSMGERDSGSIARGDVAAGVDQSAVEVDGNEARLECCLHVVVPPPPVKIVQSLDGKALRSGLFVKVFFLNGLRQSLVNKRVKA